jgi:hypothetical protein
MDTKKNDAKQAEAQATDPKPRIATLIVFGKDKGDAAKPHASWFSEADAALAEKAAGLMGMKIMRLTSDEQRQLAGKLPQGKIFQSGRCFVPFCSRTLFEQLESIGGEAPPSPESSAIETAPNDEPAVDVAASNPAQAATPTTAPSAWAMIKAGSVVLVTEGRPKEGWWEAVVTEVKADDLLVLRWRDFPEDESLIVRKRQHVALLYPAKT